MLQGDDRLLHLRQLALLSLKLPELLFKLCCLGVLLESPLGFTVKLLEPLVNLLLKLRLAIHQRHSLGIPIRRLDLVTMELLDLRSKIPIEVLRLNRRYCQIVDLLANLLARKRLGRRVTLSTDDHHQNDHDPNEIGDRVHERVFAYGKLFFIASCHRSFTPLLAVLRCRQRLNLDDHSTAFQ